MVECSLFMAKKTTLMNQKMKIGDKIKVNKGLPETLIQICGNYGLFKNEKGQVVRNLMLIPLQGKLKCEN